MYARPYLVLMISNCSTDRSFSKMKLINNRLRTSMCKDHQRSSMCKDHQSHVRQLSYVTLMSIESILSQINFEDLATELSKKKE